MKQKIDPQAKRFVEALILGDLIDCEFEEACKLVGMPLDKALKGSPLLLLTVAMIKGGRPN